MAMLEGRHRSALLRDAMTVEIGAGGDVVVRGADGSARFRLTAGDGFRLDAVNGPQGETGHRGPDGPATAVAATRAALDAVVSRYPEADRVALGAHVPEPVVRSLAAEGVVVGQDSAEPAVLADALFQRPEPWLPPRSEVPVPFSPAMSDGRRHPRRPATPAGPLYARYIPWLDSVLTFRAADPETDLQRLHRWMNDPRVAAFFEEAGDLDHHRRYLAGRLADPAMLPLIAAFDDDPFAYFEVYWAKENRLGPYYDADDYDRGWHVVVGEDAYRGRAYVAAWLPSLVHYMLLDEPRTRRIVGEPAASHVQQLRNLVRSGFAHVKTFDFPHKRAALVMLTRERFFGDRLWHPAGEAGAASAGKAA